MPRYYHSGSGGPEFGFSFRMTDAIKKLIIINVAIFLLLYISFWVFHKPILLDLFGLNGRSVLRGMIWQPVTYMFLHAGIRHILFNMLFLWMFGCDVEGMWGSRAFVRYYLLTGIGAGVLSFLTNLATGHNIVTVGASGAIFGVMVAFAMVFPDRIVLAFLFFPMRARNFVLLMGAIELLFTIGSGPSGGEVDRMAHLGGALVGFLYLKFGDRIKYSIPRIRFKSSSQSEPKAQDWSSFMREEVDPILDKIGREGIHSLTRKERSILKKARGHKRNSG